MASQLPPYAVALLNAISGTESAGNYNVIYGGSRFNDFSDHPRKAVRITSGPNAGKTSSAAGKYQFLGSTWDDYQKKLGLPDFSPQSQDQAAWSLAQDSYKNATGGNLDAALQTGDPKTIAGVGRALAPIWTSLPGGIEQGTNNSRFFNAFKEGGAAPLSPEALDFVQNNPQPGGYGAGVPQDPNNPPSVFGSMSAGLGQAPQNNGIDPNVANFAFGDEPKSWSDRLSGAGKAFDSAMEAVKAPTIAKMPAPSGDVANGLAKLMQNPQALAQLLMKQRMG